MSIEQRDSQLVSRACQGDAQAFGDLYELHLEELYRYIYYRVSPKEEAEDLTEQVFLKAWENVAAFRGEASFISWLYRIARNTIADHYRTRKPEAPLYENSPLVDGKAQPEEHVLAHDDETQLMEALSKLSPEYQDVIILRFIAGHSAKEIAEILGKSAGAIRVIQHRALNKMRAFLTIEDIIHE